MAQNVRVIPATMSRMTSAPVSEAVKRKVAGYARVSTDLEEQQNSYEAQVDYYTHYIQEHEEWEFVKVYTDEGISATSTKHREGFQKMVQDALAGEIEIFLAEWIQSHDSFENAPPFCTPLHPLFSNRYKMLPVISNIPALIIALVLVIPIALLSMKLAEKIMKKSAASLK